MGEGMADAHSKVPHSLRYTKDHEWVQVEGEQATIGITDFAQCELGDLVFVDLPAVGKSVSPGATICVVESTKAASDVYAPISGTVVAVNEALKDAPELVNKDAFGQGWLVRLSGVRPAEVDALMTAEAYQSFLSGKK
jgi:glycine cleavage system H protein